MMGSRSGRVRRETSCLLLSLLTLTLLTARASHGGADHGRSFLQRKLAGVREGLRWIATPLLSSADGGTKPSPTTVKIARVGFGRTGSTSLEAALKILGYTPLQDDLIWQVTDLFGDVFRGDITIEEWAEAMGDRGFNDVYFYSDDYYEWVARNPRIKAILSVRDDAQVWAESWLTIASFGRIFRRAPFRWLKSVQDMLPTLDAMEWVHTNGHVDGYRDLPTLRAAYEHHITRIQRVVPPERLLIFNVKQGWEPLCAFLDKPIPSQDFPHVNDRVVMSAIMATLWSVVYLWQVVQVFASLGAVYLIYNTFLSGRKSKQE